MPEKSQGERRYQSMIELVYEFVEGLVVQDGRRGEGRVQDSIACPVDTTIMSDCITAISRSLQCGERKARWGRYSCCSHCTHHYGWLYVYLLLPLSSSTCCSLMDAI